MYLGEGYDDRSKSGSHNRSLIRTRKATATLLAVRGYRVFGTSRNPANNKEAGFFMLPLDVRSDRSVAECVKEVMKHAGRIDVLINNAGYKLAGAIEEASMNEIEAQFQTNFFGPARMVKAVLPVMRRQRSGQIINVSSLAGLIGVPIHGYYSATKHALEGYTESLRYEVGDLGICVSLVEPSFLRTNFGNSAERAEATIDDYSRLRGSVHTFAEKVVAAGENPAIAADTILSIMESKAPTLRYKAGKMAKRVWRMKALLPWKLFEAGTRRNFRPKY